MTQTILHTLNSFLAARLDAKASEFIQASQKEITHGVADARFSALIALSSRYTPRQALAPTEAECVAASAALAGWNPIGWSLLETVRVSLILARNDLTSADFGERFNSWFAYADEGEACAYYRAIPFLPDPKRFVWRAAEGCRTNMRSVFMAVTCDSPYPAQNFDDVAWNQLVVKALFTETPLKRVYGFDSRLSSALVIMVLDYMDERSSAGRSIPLDAWLCIGKYGDARFALAAETAIHSDDPISRCAAILALARAKQTEHLQKLMQQSTDSAQVKLVQQALVGPIDQSTFYSILETI